MNTSIEPNPIDIEFTIAMKIITSSWHVHREKMFKRLPSISNYSVMRKYQVQWDTKFTDNDCQECQPSGFVLVGDLNSWNTQSQNPKFLG